VWGRKEKEEETTLSNPAYLVEQLREKKKKKLRGEFVMGGERFFAGGVAIDPRKVFKITSGTDLRRRNPSQKSSEVKMEAQGFFSIVMSTPQPEQGRKECWRVCINGAVNAMGKRGETGRDVVCWFVFGLRGY